MDEEMKAALTGIADGVKTCVEKITAIAEKIEAKGDDKPKDKPEDTPSPVEESLKAENASLKANLVKTEKALQDLVNLVK
jgi:hypothetical protein